MPVAPVYNTGFEHGVASVNGGGLADGLQGVVGTNVDIVTGNARTGTYSLLTAPSATAAGQWRKTLATPNIVVGRFYIKVTVLPGAGTTGVGAELNTVTTGLQPRIRLKELSGTVYFQVAIGSTAIGSDGPTITVGVWYRVDWLVDVSTATWNLLCRIDGGTEFGGTSVQASADTVNSFRLGQGGTTGPAFTAYYDDVIVSQTLADYPIGPGEGRAIWPIADGTHNPATPDCIRGGGASPALISGSNVAWQYMDDSPFPSGTSPTTDRINQDTATGAHPTHYVEMTFSQMAGANRLRVNGVEGLLAYGGDSATTNKGSTVVIDRAGTETAVYGTSATPADMSETSVFYKSAKITMPGAGWNLQEVNALKMRIGYSNDVSPNPYWQALMLEIDVTPQFDGLVLNREALIRSYSW